MAKKEGKSNGEKVWVRKCSEYFVFFFAGRKRCIGIDIDYITREKDMGKERKGKKERKTKYELNCIGGNESSDRWYNNLPIRLTVVSIRSHVPLSCSFFLDSYTLLSLSLSPS